jgi:hypothetical protein
MPTMMLWIRVCREAGRPRAWPVFRLLVVLALVLGYAGPSAPPAAADAPLQITDEATVRVRHVPNRVRVGESFTIELVFHNRSSQDLVASIPASVPGGLQGLADYRFEGHSCAPGPSVWSGSISTAGSAPSLRVVEAGTSCVTGFTQITLGGVIPANSQVSYRITTSGGAPGTFPFFLIAGGQIQRSEIRVVQPDVGERPSWRRSSRHSSV